MMCQTTQVLLTASLTFSNYSHRNIERNQKYTGSDILVVSNCWGNHRSQHRNLRCTKRCATFRDAHYSSVEETFLEPQQFHQYIKLHVKCLCYLQAVNIQLFTGKYKLKCDFEHYLLLLFGNLPVIYLIIYPSCKIQFVFLLSILRYQK